MNEELIKKIEALEFRASDAMIAKVLELHGQDVKESTIRKAHRALAADYSKAKKDAKLAEASAKEATTTAAAASA